MAKLEIRKVDSVIGETGSGGDRTETTYQFGGEIDGVFVPFVTKSAGYIDHLVSNEKARQEADKSSSKTDTSDSTTDES